LNLIRSLIWSASLAPTSWLASHRAPNRWNIFLWLLSLWKWRFLDLLDDHYFIFDVDILYSGLVLFKHILVLIYYFRLWIGLLLFKLILKLGNIFEIFNLIVFDLFLVRIIGVNLLLMHLLVLCDFNWILKIYILRVLNLLSALVQSSFKLALILLQLFKFKFA